MKIVLMLGIFNAYDSYYDDFSVYDSYYDPPKCKGIIKTIGV